MSHVEAAISHLSPNASESEVRAVLVQLSWLTVSPAARDRLVDQLRRKVRMNRATFKRLARHVGVGTPA